jgi:Flp pilus assembly protein TadD
MHKRNIIPIRSSRDSEASAIALERAIELDSASAEAFYALATALGLQGKAEEAVARAELARELRPKDGAIVNILGVSLMLADDPAGAESALREAIQLSPGVPAYHNNLALSLTKQERYGEALQSFQRGGDEQAAYNNLGYGYFLNGRYAEAISRYESALSMPGAHKLAVLRNLNEALDARDLAARLETASSDGRLARD